MTRVRTWVWITVIIALAAVCVALSLVFYLRRPAGAVAKVYVDGQCVYTVDLSKVQQPYQYEIQTPYGVNTLSIVPGDMCILHADCHDHTCVRQGWLVQGGMDLVCLPHRLVVQRQNDDVDAVAR